jgi:hypothetical protein
MCNIVYRTHTEEMNRRIPKPDFILSGVEPGSVREPSHFGSAPSS